MITLSRIFYRLAYWPCLLAHRVFGTSYEWVNVGIGAWNRDSFNPLWQWEWYGLPVTELPRRLVLCGIGYTVSENDGQIRFKEDSGMGTGIIAHERDRSTRLWYVTVSGRVPSSHVDESYRWVKARYGGNFEERT